MKTLIEIKDLRIQAYHGVLPQERVVGNMYSINLTIHTDFTKAMASDSLEDTIDYGEAARIVEEEMKIPSQLLEHVAGRIITKIEGRWGEKVLGLDLTIAKLTPPLGMNVESTRVHIIK